MEVVSEHGGSDILLHVFGEWSNSDWQLGKVASHQRHTATRIVMYKYLYQMAPKASKSASKQADVDGT